MTVENTLDYAKLAAKAVPLLKKLLDRYTPENAGDIITMARNVYHALAMLADGKSDFDTAAAFLRKVEHTFDETNAAIDAKAREKFGK